MASKWAAAKPVVVTRASLEHGGKTTYRWEPDLRYGTFESNLAAKRAYIEALWPNMKGATDAYVRRFWNGEPRQAHYMKIVKVEA